MKLYNSRSTLLILLLSFLTIGALNAEVYKIVIKERVVIAYGYNFGEVGQYE